jgi:peptidoglycan/LPS O-acetylase OafA/YrhL
MKQAEIPSLNGLRFLAALTIVLVHGVPKIVIYPDPPTWLRLIYQTAAFGMTLFFVLSGFVIFLNYSQKISTGTDLRNFFVARFARLYPLYFVCIAFDLLMKYSYNQPPNLAALPYYLTMTQSWFYQIIGEHSLIYQYGLLPQVSWSISTEWMFYFAFPLIAAAIALAGPAKKNKTVACLGLAVVAIVFIATISWHRAEITAFGVSHFGPQAGKPQDALFRWITYFSPYVRIFEFALGCVCASIYMASRKPSRQEERLGLVLTVFAVAATVAIHLLLFANPQQSLSILQSLRANFAYAPTAALLIFCCARYQNPIVAFFSNKWIVLGGEASYSIYFLHLIVINAFRYEAATITSWNVALGSYLQLGVVLASIIGLSLISWRFIEVPSRRVIRRLLSAPVSTPTVQQTA